MASRTHARRVRDQRMRAARTASRSVAVPDVPEPEVVDGELVEELTREQAEFLTERIQLCVKNWHMFAEQTTELALEAFHKRAFKVLGYPTWNAYAADKFSHLEMPRSTQEAIHAALINEGQISGRSAAAVTGADHKTAIKDAKNARTTTGESSPLPKQRTGADGKKRAARKPVKARVTEQPARDNLAESSGHQSGADNVISIRPEPSPQNETKEQNWARSPKYLGLGWQNVAGALGDLVVMGEPNLTEKNRDQIVVQLRAAAAFLTPAVQADAPCYLNAVDGTLRELLDPAALASLSARDMASLAELLTGALAEVRAVAPPVPGDRPVPGDQEFVIDALTPKDLEEVANAVIDTMHENEAWQLVVLLEGLTARARQKAGQVEMSL
jgi:hypothetical protein